MNFACMRMMGIKSHVLTPTNELIANRFLTGLLYYCLLIVEALHVLLYYLLLIVEVQRFNVIIIATNLMIGEDVGVYYPIALPASKTIASSSFRSLNGSITQTIQSRHYL